MKPFEHPPRTTSLSKTQVAAVLWNLHIMGPAEDKSGSAARVLLKRLIDNGHPMSINTLNRIVNSFTEVGNGPAHLSDYPYNYINRTMNTKKTFKIELIVDPKTVPFPANPYKDRPRFLPANLDNGTPAEPVTTPAPDEPGETFARQAQFDGIATGLQPVAEPEPEPVVRDELEPEPDTDDLVVEPGELEPYVAPVQARANGTNGSDDDFDDVDLDEFGLNDDDLFADLGQNGARSSSELIATAIAMLSDALAKGADERVALVNAGIGDQIGEQIDARLGEYRLLQEHNTELEGKLRHVLGQYERLMDLARRLRRENELLKRQLVVARRPAQSRVPT